MTADGETWVFGYGSLMWDPGFGYEDRVPALLTGYHRSFCIYSHIWRGTPDRPGLVLGLDRGGSCRGIAFKIRGDEAPGILAYLRGRELPTEIYVQRRLNVRMAAQSVAAVTFVVNRAHDQYAANLSDDDAARLVLQGEGQGGSNRDYLANTVVHLDALGIADGPIHRLLDHVESLGESNSEPQGGRK